MRLPWRVLGGQVIVISVARILKINIELMHHESLSNPLQLITQCENGLCDDAFADKHNHP
jgi:hypothetical protein